MTCLPAILVTQLKEPRRLLETPAVTATRHRQFKAFLEPKPAPINHPPFEPVGKGMNART